ncbi:PREDICTED: protein PIH1D3 [Papilio xuthus]|uniref:Protein PIH1D3 n=1 Tax=Papilio xuthus TaxID=66420 RepID=A0AAJ6ZA14_PAPXU|nr:PREDICTED: protein PIH1D3 [Papilio xuthus]
MEFTHDAMTKLKELLREPEPEVLQGDDLPFSGYEITSNRDKVPCPSTNDTKGPRTIEEYEEQEAAELDSLAGPGGGAGDRKAPEYTMNYQQSVSAEDVFLQMGPKTPSSASCENLVVRIKLPGDKKENVELTVDTKSVTIQSPQYYLKLALPHDIDPDNSKANWDSVKESLVLTLKLDREFDFVNF